MDKQFRLLQLEFDVWKSFLTMGLIIFFPFAVALVVYPQTKTIYFAVVAFLLILTLIIFAVKFIQATSKLNDYLKKQ